MASGVGYAVRSLPEYVKVIGLQPVGAAAMALSWRQRTVVETGIETIADGVARALFDPRVMDDLLVVLDGAMLVREDSTKVVMRMLTRRRQRLWILDRVKPPYP